MQPRAILCSDATCADVSTLQTPTCPADGACPKYDLVSELHLGALLEASGQLTQLQRVLEEVATPQRMVALDGYTTHPSTGSNVAILELGSGPNEPSPPMTLMVSLKRGDEPLNVTLDVRDGLS